MSRQREQIQRILGPYKDGPGKYKIYLVQPSGQRASESFGSESEAKRAKAQYEKQIAKANGLTLEKALEGYEKHLKDKGNKPGSIATTLFRLKAFFPDLTEKVILITPTRAEGYYDALTERPKPNLKKEDEGKKISVDTHRNTLGQVKTFFRWCVKKKYITKSPLEEVQGKGKRSRGKPQLRFDEARAWLKAAIVFMDKGEAGAVAATSALLMGPRSSEILARPVRDLDDDGRLFWIEKSKTERGDRILPVPQLLQPYLLALAKGKKPEDPLFPCRGRAWVLDWTKRICKAAGVKRVTAHSLRGFHATVAVICGATGELVAQALGHTPEVNRAHYLQPAALPVARQERALQVLEGGKK